MKTYDFPEGAALFHVQRFSNQQGWSLIKVRWINDPELGAHWRAYYV